MQVNFGDSTYEKTKDILADSFIRGRYKAYYLGDNKTLVSSRWDL